MMRTFASTVFDLLFVCYGILLAAGANMEREVNMAGSLGFHFLIAAGTSMHKMKEINIAGMLSFSSR